MRNAAREAALNIIFAQQFNSDCMDSLQKKIFKQFGLLENKDDLRFALDLVSVVNTNRVELLAEIENACHHYLQNRIVPYHYHIEVKLKN